MRQWIHSRFSKIGHEMWVRGWVGGAKKPHKTYINPHKAAHKYNTHDPTHHSIHHNSCYVFLGVYLMIYGRAYNGNTNKYYY